MAPAPSFQLPTRKVGAYVPESVKTARPDGAFQPSSMRWTPAFSHSSQSRPSRWTRLLPRSVHTWMCSRRIPGYAASIASVTCLRGVR